VPATKVISKDAPDASYQSGTRPKPRRILYLTSSHEDYLSDSLLVGFRALFGAEVVDYPRAEILYRNCPDYILRQVRGHGFTLYTGLLEDMPVDRYYVSSKLSKGAYDLVVFSDIWRQFGLFTQWRPFLHPGNTIILDGMDSPQVYPHAGYWWRRPYYWGLPRVDGGFLYFKREWTEDSRFDLWHRLLPAGVRGKLPFYRGMRKISFAFPDAKILSGPARKEKLFGRHVVDAEVAAKVPGSVTAYAFSREAEYYADLQASRFGITMKKSGWDCLRHYEIAANGCVPCFRDLRAKPDVCAPHGLLPGVNCLDYRNADDLLAQVAALPEAAYVRLREGALHWVRSKSSITLAGEVVAEWEKYQRSWGLNDGELT
jgi:hypothetical protein